MGNNDILHISIKQAINCLLSMEGKKQVYLDVSGSMPYQIKMIDFLNKKKNVELFGFHDEIVPLDNKFYAGGTSFFPIRDAVENAPLHPDIILVITDGYMNGIVPLKFPKRWHFILVNTELNVIQHLPKGANYHQPVANLFSAF